MAAATALFISAALAASLLVAGCRKEESGAALTDAAASAGTEIERGPVKVAASVTPGKPRLSDNPEFELAVEAEEGVDVAMPPFGDALGDFLIRGFRRPLPETRGSRRLIRQIYELEPVGVGEHFIHPITVTFTDNRPGGDGKEHVVETEGFTVVVQSVLGEKIPALAELDPPAAPVELPAEPFSVAWLLLAVPPAAAAAVLYAVWRRRRRSMAAAVPALSPRELAWIELKRLVEAGFVEQGRFQAYYAELTAIVRRFIERTTGVRAPEQTTEEFLREAGHGAVFPLKEQQRLKAFLESADLVKFAAQRPGKKQIEASFERAKEFTGISEASGGPVGDEQAEADGAARKVGAGAGEGGR